MVISKDIDDLQINEDIEFQRHSWIVQRIGWGIFAFVALLAALGLFGDGMLSNAQAGRQDGGLWLEYPRYQRFEHEFQLKVRVSEGTAAENEIRIQLDQEYLYWIEVNHISPEPDRQFVDVNGITYIFKTNGNTPFTAHFYVISHKAGRLAGTFRRPNGETVDFFQFIYP